MNTENAYSIADKHLGACGRMISGSKSGYVTTYPNNFPIFNSNVCTKKLGKIWYGDLDITKDEDKLRALSKELNEEVYVLREMDARFKPKPDFEKFAYMVAPDGEGSLGTACEPYYKRVKNKLVKKDA